MQIELVKQTFNSCEKYKYKPLCYCCKELKSNTAIELHDEYGSLCFYRKKIRDIIKDSKTMKPGEDEYPCSCDCKCSNSIPQMMMHKLEVFYDPVYGPDGESEQDFYYPIKFCPFCGEPIEVKIVLVEDKTEYYNHLMQERDAILKKFQKTDSKSEERDLLKQRNEWDNLINNLYELGEYAVEQSG